MNLPMTSKNIKIIISGWYGQSNAGDDALLEVFVNKVSEKANADITVLTERPEYLIDKLRLRPLFHQTLIDKQFYLRLFTKSTFQYIRNIKSCDLFVLGGGSLLRDNTPLRTLVRMLDEIWISKLFGRKIMLYAIGVGPFKSKLGKFLIRKSVQMCDLITVRSNGDAKMLHALGIDPARVHVVSDPGFLTSLTPIKDRNLLDLISKPKRIAFYPALGLVRNGNDFSYVKSVANAFDKLASEYGFTFVAIPMFIREKELDDRKVAHVVKTAMNYPEALDIYEGTLSPSEIKWVSSQVLLNVTVRLHAMIFSIGTGTPAVAVNYGLKVQNIFSELGCLEYLVEMDQSLEESLFRAVDNCMRHSDSYAGKIASFNKKAEQSAEDIFRLMDPIFDDIDSKKMLPGRRSVNRSPT